MNCTIAIKETEIITVKVLDNSYAKEKFVAVWLDSVTLLLGGTGTIGAGRARTLGQLLLDAAEAIDENERRKLNMNFLEER